MRTMINGKEAPWTPEIDAKWAANLNDFVDSDRFDEHARVTDANYFTPRPYVDEYNRGSREEGFTFTIGSRHVYQSIISRRTSIEGEPPK